MIFYPGGTEVQKELVLIGVVRRKIDLELVQREHWYRIPSHLTFRYRPRYLALYPTSGCGTRGGAITFYTTIKKISRVRRGELLPREKKHPRAKEWYWKLQLGPIQHLPHRIANRLRRRLTFAYTTRDRLLRAEEIGELFGIPPLEEILRKALLSARISSLPQFCVMSRKKCRYRIDFALFCRKGKIALECDHSRWHQRPERRVKDRQRDRWLKRHGWTVMHFSEDEITERLSSVIRSIKSRIRALGSQQIGES